MKNINAIEKMIKELALKDYLKVNQKKTGGFYKKHRPYALSAETQEAREIKQKYLNDEITENEYKGYCLKFNLLNK